MEKTIFSMNNDFTVSRKKCDAYKSLLQELEKEIYKYDFGGFVLRAIQDLKKKYGAE
jgi:protein tyrosine phosphatase